MKVHDIMTRDVVSCRQDADVGAAGRLMLDGHVGTLPVVDPDGRLVGIITDRDIAMAAATRQRNASHIVVHEAMTEHVRSCFGNEDIAAALETMEDARVRRLPVVDADGRLVGIVAMDDIVLRALDRPDGISSHAVISALKRISAAPDIEPDLRTAEVFVSG